VTFVLENKSWKEVNYFLLGVWVLEHVTLLSSVGFAFLGESRTDRMCDGGIPALFL
jgi:hypothetical protein